MKLTTKIESCSATKDIRYCLNGVYVDIENQAIVATDGHCMAVLPQEIEPPNDANGIPETKPGYIVPFDAIKQYRRESTKLNPAELTVNGSIQINGKTGSTTTFDPIDGRFPDWQKAVPEKTETVICLNAELLKRVQDAIVDIDTKHKGVRIYIKDKDSPIRVEPIGNNPDNRVGVVMPMRDSQ
jgi:DNA polymerase III sliding clamp (beta) subunit (PCNA family)